MNIAIFASGEGTNCENIIKYFSGRTDINVALVLSNKSEAKVLAKAANYGVPSVYMGKADFNNEDKLMAVMKEYNIDFIVLAGFLLMIPGFLVDAYNHKIVNIHPALLPKHGGKGMYGHHVHEAVKAAGDKKSGITIHWVNNVCDGGEIIEQWDFAIKPEDTIDDIEKNIHILEQANYPKAIEKAINDTFNLSLYNKK